jgi:hypothetical protein
MEQVLRVIREGQAEFRKRLVAHYGAVCMVTGTALANVSTPLTSSLTTASTNA